MKRRQRLLLTVLLLSVISLVSGVVSYAVAWGFTHALQANGLPRPYVILSGSMEPAQPVGSVIITLPYRNYRSGDIVTFKAGEDGGVTTHRIISQNIQTQSYTTKGDANNEADPLPVADSSIIGKTILTIPFLGYASELTKKPQGFILLIIVPATILIYEELKTLWKEIKRLMKKGITKLRKKPLATPMKQPTKLPLFVILIVSACVPILMALTVTIRQSRAYQSDVSNSRQNVFQAATSFQEMAKPFSVEELFEENKKQGFVSVILPSPIPTVPEMATDSADMN